LTYEARILADSMAPCGKRLTTMQITIPRIVLAEFNTHRQFSRNSASSRAIPVEKMLKRVMDDPFIPARFPKNQKGMQAGEWLDGEAEEQARSIWLEARQKAVDAAQGLILTNAHKQIANRLLEPFLWHTIIVTATEWSNFFAQRCHKDAQPEIQTIAYMMQALLETNKPACVEAGDYHLPLVQPDELEACTLDLLIKLSVARCARVSYLTHEGKRDHDTDFQLYDRLREGMHMSPFEHVAWASMDDSPSGNFVGWVQHRKAIANECR